MELKQKIKPVKKEKSFGRIYVSSADFPDIKDMSIGDEETIHITVQIKALRAPDQWDISEKKVNPTDVIAEFNISNLEKCSMKKDKK